MTVFWDCSFHVTCCSCPQQQANATIKKQRGGISSTWPTSQITRKLIVMSLLFLLPEVIAFEIVSQWLLLSDVNRVDTSFSSLVERPQLLNILARGVFQSEYLEMLNFCAITWVSIRNISLKNLSITFQYQSSEQFEKFPINMKNTEKLYLFFYNDDSSFLTNMANRCENLKELSFEGCYDQLHQIKASVLKNLNVFVLSGVVPDSDNNPRIGTYIDKAKDSFNYLIKHCRNLTQISYSNYFFDAGEDAVDGVNQNDFIELLKVNPNIKNIEDVCLASGNDALLKAIAKHCRNLENISSLVLYDDYQVPNIADIILSCPKVTAVEVNREYTPGKTGDFCYIRKINDVIKRKHENMIEFGGVNASQEIIENSLLVRSLDFEPGELEGTLRKLGGLQSIEIIDSAVVPITGELIRIIATKNPALHTLVISSCAFGNDVTSSDLSLVLNKCPMLHTIRLNGLNVFSDTELRALFSVKLPNLTDLSLASHVTLSDATVDSILSANKLKRLCVDYCVDIHSEFFQFPGLEKYDMNEDELEGVFSEEEGEESDDEGVEEGGEE